MGPSTAGQEYLRARPARNDDLAEAASILKKPKTY
jgi:hypothetical protein